MLESNQSVVKNEGISFTPVPEGVYGVEVVDINFRPKEEQKFISKFPPKDKYYITLGILDEGENRGRVLTHFVSTSFNAGFTGGSPSKLYEFACAVMGENLDDKKELDLNTLIGGKVTVIVKETVKPDGKVFSNITEVMKMSPSKKYEPLTEDERLYCLPKGEDDVSDLPLDLGEDKDK